MLLDTLQLTLGFSSKLDFMKVKKTIITIDKNTSHHSNTYICHCIY